MVKGMTGADRRKRILSLMREAGQPLSGVTLGKETGVSRQVVVQDIALLRTEGYPIISTTRGLPGSAEAGCPSGQGISYQ